MSIPDARSGDLPPGVTPHRDQRPTATTGNQAAPSSARWRDRIGNPLDWSSSDKALGVALAVLVFALWWAIMIEYFAQHPEVLPYAEPSGLRLSATLLWGVTAGLIAVCGWALVMRRRRPDSAGPMYALALVYVVLFGVATHGLGLYTNMISSVLILGGFSMGLTLWGRAPAIMALVLMVATAFGLSLGNVLGIVPYSVGLRTAPFHDGRLDPLFLIVIGSSSFAAMGMFILVTYLVIRRWQDRETALARAHAVIARYVPSQVAEEIRIGHYEALERHARRKLTILFADIQGFAAIADVIEPEDLSTVLNEYLAEMSAIGERYGGTIDKFVGDAVMVYFGAPVATNDRDHALRAVRMAVEMQQRLVSLREKWEQEGFEYPFHMRVGLNTGQATIGAFGSPGRMDYTIIGRHVNLAARLQAHCEPDRILLSRSTWILIRDEVACEPIGEIQVKGFQQPMPAYEIRPLASAPTRS